MAGLLRHWHFCQSHHASSFAPWHVGNVAAGFLRHDLAQSLVAEKLFHATEKKLFLAHATGDLSDNTKLLKNAAHHVQQKFFPQQQFYRELYDIKPAWDAPARALLDRTAMPWFGAPAWGLHVNGFVRRDRDIFLWIGERSPHLVVDPLKLDHLFAGGQPTGLTLQENLRKEGQEEANLPPLLVDQAKLIKTIHYKRDVPSGLRNDHLFVYDLEMPEHVTPENTDGEVSRFTLMPAQDVLSIIRTTDRFKFNCALVIIDFCLRHGLLRHDDDEYDELVKVFGEKLDCKNAL